MSSDFPDLNHKKVRELIFRAGRTHYVKFLLMCYLRLIYAREHEMQTLFPDGEAIMPANKWPIGLRIFTKFKDWFFFVR